MIHDFLKFEYSTLQNEDHRQDKNKVVPKTTPMYECTIMKNNFSAIHNMSERIRDWFSIEEEMQSLILYHCLSVPKQICGGLRKPVARRKSNQIKGS